MIQQLFKENLKVKECGDDAGSIDRMKSYFRYAEWEHAELILRYYGLATMLGRGGGLREMTVRFIRQILLKLILRLKKQGM